MDSLLHPVGPEARTVYWTRRAVVIGVLLVLIGLLVAMCTRQPDSAPPVVATPAASSTAPSATPTTPTSPSSATTSAKATSVTTGPTNEVRVSPATKRPSTSASASATATTKTTKAGGVCDPEQLKVTVAAVRSAKTGDPVKVRYTITNEAKTACKVSWSDKVVSMTIVSGSDRIWTTAHCATWVPSDTVKLAAGKSTDFIITWQGKRSRNECKLRDDARPKAGTYVIIAKFTDVATIRRALVLKK